MTTITNLPLSPSVQESLWILNVTETNAVTGVAVVPAVEEYTHIIKSIMINSSGANKWIEILDGENVVIGPLSLNKNAPLEIVFETSIYCSQGNALLLKTEAEFDVHLIITGNTLPPLFEAAHTPTPVNGAVGIGLSPELSWSSSPQVISSNVYINDILAGTSSTGSFTAGPLVNETVYVWRVDDFDGNTTITGGTWSFTTV